MSKQYNVLLVEDDRLDYKIFQKSFSNKAKGINLIWRKDGNEALGFVENNKTDLILLDLLLPDIDGTEVIHKIVELGVDVPVVIISQVTEPSRIIELLKKEQVKDYFIKSDMIHKKNFVDILIGIIEEYREKIRLKKLFGTALGKELVCQFLSFLNQELEQDLNVMEGTIDLISGFIQDDNVKMGVNEISSALKGVKSKLQNNENLDERDICLKFIQFIDDRSVEIEN